MCITCLVDTKEVPNFQSGVTSRKLYSHVLWEILIPQLTHLQIPMNFYFPHYEGQALTQYDKILQIS